MKKFKVFKALTMCVLLHTVCVLHAAEIVLQNDLNGYNGCEDSWFEKGRDVPNTASTDMSMMSYHCQS